MDEDIGTARIVYDDPDDGTVERTVENEHIAYFQDHWLVKIGEDEGRDTVRRIPIQRVHYVERDVEAFEEEVRTLKSQVRSLADEIRSKLPGQQGDEADDEDVTRIDVETGEER